MFDVFLVNFGYTHSSHPTLELAQKAAKKTGFVCSIFKSNNPFEVHDIKYLSPSSINTYISDIPMWVARYLFGIKSSIQVT